MAHNKTQINLKGIDTLALVIFILGILAIYKSYDIIGWILIILSLLKQYKKI